MTPQLPDTTRIAAELATITENANALVVKDEQSYVAAMNGQGTARNLRKRIEFMFAEVKRDASQRHAAICAAEKAALTPALDADRLFGVKAVNWRNEQRAAQLAEKQRLEAQIRAKQEAERIAAKARADAERKAEEDRRLAAAEKWANDGMPEVGLDIIANAPPTPPESLPVIPEIEVILPPNVPVVAGASVRETWYAEVDLRELIEGVASGETSIDMALVVLAANQPECNRLARSQKGELRIRGITVRTKESTAHR